jgi:hypothetical protein
MTERVNPDPYPSGIYSVLSYPTQSPVEGPTSNGHGPEVLAHIGDIEVTSTTMRIPAGGAVALSSVTVEVVDERVVRTPTWAVICAIVGFFVVPVVSLLFLLFREEAPTGEVRVVVTSGDLRYEAVVTDPAEIELARSLAAS